MNRKSLARYLRTALLPAVVVVSALAWLGGDGPVRQAPSQPGTPSPAAQVSPSTTPFRLTRGFPLPPISPAPTPTASASSPQATPAEVKAKPRRPRPRKAKNGRNLRACRDGSCEVEVRAGDVIRFSGAVARRIPLIGIAEAGRNGLTIQTSSAFLTTYGDGAMYLNEAIAISVVHSKKRSTIIRITRIL